MKNLLQKFWVLIFITSNAIVISTSAFGDEIDDQENKVRGVVKAKQEAVLSAELSARIIEIPFRAGDAFKKGDLLIGFDCEVQKAEADAVHAAHFAAQSRHKNNEEMKEYDAIGQFDLNISKAEMREAAARSRAMAARVQNCNIKAPYDGKVADLYVHAFEKPGPDQPLLKIVGRNDLELKLIVPSTWLGWLSADGEFDFVVDETGNTHPVSIEKIGAEVDAVSRTVPIIATFNTPPQSVLPGMSGTASFSIPAE